MNLTHLRLVSTKGTLANSGDPDHMPQNAASDQGLHCLHLVKKFVLIIIIKTNLTPFI